MNDITNKQHVTLVTTVLDNLNLASPTFPMEVVIHTAEYEVKGYVHVSRETREERRISELLNTPDKRFLAVTNAQLLLRNKPSSTRFYAFIQLHVNTIQMVHPSSQAIFRQESYGNQEAEKFQALRQRLTTSVSATL